MGKPTGEEQSITTYLTGGSQDDPNITEGKKHYIFSATGNIMVATTDADSSNVDDKVRDVFNEVSVFFAAMTKAITTTKRPGKQDEYYSLYNYAALQKIIGGSGCFIHCTQEDIQYSSSSFGADFSKNLLEALLGLPSGGGALSFAQAMIASLGKEGLKLAGETESNENEVGNIVFVCELLFGMPIISAIVVYVDSKKNSKVFSAGPCIKASQQSITMTMHKDVYMFVTPTFIKSYASDLDSIFTSSDYGTFISYLKSLLTNDVIISGVYNNDTEITGNELSMNTVYTIKGNNFGNFGELYLGNDKLNTDSWSDQSVSFTPTQKAEALQALKLVVDGKEYKVGDFLIKE